MMKIHWIDRFSQKFTDRVFALVMLALYLSATVLFTYINFQTRQSELLSVTKSTLFTSAISSEHLIGVDFGERFTKDSPPDQAIYRYLVKKLNKWVDTLPVTYVYLMDKVGEDVYFVISNETKEDIENGYLSLFYNPYPSAPPSLLKSFQTKETEFSPYYQNDWGQFQSVFVPVEREDGSVYVLAADIKVDGSNALLLQSARQSLWIALFLLLPLMPMMYLYAYLQKKKKKEFKESLYKHKPTNLPNLHQIQEDIGRNNHFHSGILIAFADTSEISGIFGQAAIEELFVNIAQSLRSVLPSSATLYLIEEREFFILYDDANEEKLLLLSEKVLQHLNCCMKVNSLSMDDQEIVITAKIGIVNRVQGCQVVECARDALANAIKLGQSLFLYKPGTERDKHSENSYYWQKEVLHALQEDRIVPFFQPIYENAYSKVTRYEMLVRLIDKEGKVITPYFFLDAIRGSYLYKKMTCCMIEKGFAAFSDREESVTLNLCKADLLDKDTVSFLQSSIERFDLQGKVTVEVVESDWIGYQDEVLEVLSNLRSSGICVAIDDFGSGFSNFDQLLKMEVDYLKIDGSLIKAMFVNDRAFSMVEAIIALANGLGVPVIPEFVENEAMLETLKELGCEYLQGYVIGKPVSGKELPN